jgi:hypothetical protein
MPTTSILVTSAVSVLLGYPPAGGAFAIQNLAVPGGTGPPGLTVYLGTASTVTSPTGFPLPPGSTYDGYGFAPLGSVPVYAIAPAGNGGSFQSAYVSVNATVS